MTLIHPDSEPTTVLGGYTAGPTPAQPMAAAAPPARLLAVLGAFALAGAGGAGAWTMGQEMDVTAFRVGSDMSAFAGLVAFAAAMERLLEPFTRWMPGRRARNAYERAVEALANGRPGATPAQVAATKARCDQHRADRALIAWGLATGIATVLAAGSGFYLLRMIAESSAWAGLPAWIDALVTGIVVGTGTKPLHDLFTRIQPG